MARNLVTSLFALLFCVGSPGFAQLTPDRYLSAARALNQSDRFDAVVSSYPPCHIVPANKTPPYDLVLSEIDQFGNRP